jgi:hypothetical protein
MYGVPFWQKLNPLPAAQRLSPFAHATANRLIAQAQAPKAGGIPKSHLRGPGPHNGDWLRQYGTLPPAQQEQKLQNDPMYRSLTPENQKHLMDRLRFFNSLTPQKKQQVLDRMETFEHLPPEKQQQAQALFQKYEGLPADQRSQVSQAYRQLRQMSPEQRTQFFNSDEFHGFNDEQRNLLRGMSDLYPSQVK